MYVRLKHIDTSSCGSRNTSVEELHDLHVPCSLKRSMPLVPVENSGMPCAVPAASRRTQALNTAHSLFQDVIICDVLLEDRREREGLEVVCGDCFGLHPQRCIHKGASTKVHPQKCIHKSASTKVHPA
eukprot:1160017-Pelagomonas_calceolata.AAC.7